MPAIMSMMRHWNKLPGQPVDATFLEVFKVKMERALSNLVLCKISVFMQGDWNI